MLKDDFISRVEGIPWSNRACTFDAADCWGLVVLYYRHVLGIEIHQTVDYESGRDFMTCCQTLMSCSGSRAPRSLMAGSSSPGLVASLCMSA